MIASRPVLLLLISALATTGVNGQPTDEFYNQKQIRIIVGYPPGGDYDVGARLLAKHLGKHIPGHPSVIVQNMPGASSVVTANFVFSRAPQDGTVIGSFSRNLPSQTVLGQSGLQADLRQFAWIGGTSRPSVRICVMWHAKQVKTAGDLFQHELIVAGTGPSSAPSIIPTVLNNVLGTKFRVVEGYRGTTQSTLAMERGEVEGVCRSLSQFRTLADKLRSGEIRILLHVDDSPIPEFPDVPSAFSYTKSDLQRQMLRFVFSSEKFVRSYVLPPNVPADRIAIMRRAIAETVNDPDLVAEAAKADIDMSYQAPDGLIALVQELYGASPELIERVKKLVPISN